MNVLLVLTLVSVAVYLAEAGCGANTLSECRNIFHKATIEGDNRDQEEICKATQDYVNCLEPCQDDESAKEALEPVKQALEACSGTSISVSVVCLLCAVFTAVFRF